MQLAKPREVTGRTTSTPKLATLRWALTINYEGERCKEISDNIEKAGENPPPQKVHIYSGNQNFLDLTNVSIGHPR